MKVLQVNTSSQIGGAGIAAWRLHRGLRTLSTDSMMLVDKAAQSDTGVLTPATVLDKVMARANPILDRIPGQVAGVAQDRVSSSWMPTRLVTRINAVSPDIVNLHWINDGFLSTRGLTRIKQPLVWTLHDMWAFSGGEHYVGESTRYREGYTATNRPPGEKGLDVNRWIWSRKKVAWSGKLQDMVVVTPSRWLAGCAADSLLLGGQRIEVLPNGVDHERFRPMDHAVVREILGMPPNKKLILFGAGSPTIDKRKGFHLLLDALNRLETIAKAHTYQLVVFGASSSEQKFPFPVSYLGELNDEISMALVYAAADVFVAPSVQENLANTVLESLSCGTPVAAFDIGGMPDMIENGRNGCLAPAYDTTELAKAIVEMTEDNETWAKLSAGARQTVVNNFTLEKAASRYLELYEELLGGRGS